ncbi:MAG: hypothetical protein GY801_20845, partial [bacterium]|nr:hypothetical protein [bacterium]
MIRPRIAAIVFLAIACVGSLFSLFPFMLFSTTPRIEDIDFELFDTHTRYLFFIHKSHIHDELRRILYVTARVRELIHQVPPHAIRITIPDRPGDGGIMEYYLWTGLTTALQAVPEEIRETLLANIRVLALDKGEDGIGSTTYTEGQFLG